jgi:hypothetical protein
VIACLCAKGRAGSDPPSPIPQNLLKFTYGVFHVRRTTVLPIFNVIQDVHHVVRCVVALGVLDQVLLFGRITHALQVLLNCRRAGLGRTAVSALAGLLAADVLPSMLMMSLVFMMMGPMFMLFVRPDYFPPYGPLNSDRFTFLRIGPSSGAVAANQYYMDDLTRKPCLVSFIFGIVLLSVVRQESKRVLQRVKAALP